MSITSTFNITLPCLLCGDNCKEAMCLCDACLNELPYIKSACKSCGLPLNDIHSDKCGSCVTTPPPVHQAISVLHYDSPVDYLIKHMKYHNQLSIAELLGKLLVDKIKEFPGDLPEQIIPVPLHVERLKRRGYNQAIEIARPISRALNIPINLTDCTRVKATAPQIDLPASERGKNIKNAFEISTHLKSRHIAILDDVMTTGSTVWEIADTLLASGVEQVDVWTCARATVS